MIRRLPKYYRYISEMKDNGVQRVSSMNWAKKGTCIKYARTLTVLEDLGSRVMDIMCRSLWR